MNTVWSSSTSIIRCNFRDSGEEIVFDDVNDGTPNEIEEQQLSSFGEFNNFNPTELCPEEGCDSRQSVSATPVPLSEWIQAASVS
jgi:hypothetical protein